MFSPVISQPMDFQTMHKKVKQKAYKSKLEFQDDLNLIWTNCYTYNATEVHLTFPIPPLTKYINFTKISITQNHPLRQCVKRLEQKANRLLQNITDRKDRMDPPLPSNLPASSSYSSSSLAGIARPRINGVSTSSSGSINGTYVNGSRTGYGHGRTPSGTVVGKGYVKSFASKRGVRFEDSPAIVRTPEGMRTFRDLSMGVDEVGGWGDLVLYPPGSSSSQASGSGMTSEKGKERETRRDKAKEGEEKEMKEVELRDMLRELAPVMEVEVEVKDEEDDAMSVDSPLAGGSAGEKRKL